MNTATLDNAEFIPRIGDFVNEGHSVTIQVRGFSMRPFVENARDKAVIVKCSTVRRGDAVLAKVEGGRFVLHRVVRVEGDRLTLMGDGNVCGTEHCRTSDIVGKVAAFIRKGRTKPDSTDGTKWKVYSFLWMHLRWARRWLLAFYRLIWLPVFRRKDLKYENQ